MSWLPEGEALAAPADGHLPGLDGDDLHVAGREREGLADAHDEGASAVLEERRRDQERQWVWQLVREQLEDRFRHDPRVATLLPELEAAVARGEVPAVTAARRLLDAFDDG